MDHKNISNLKDRIAKHKIKKKSRVPISNGNQAFNIAVELVAGVIVGLAIGLFFDNRFDSKPIFTILCLIFAIIASFKLIWNKYIK